MSPRAALRLEHLGFERVYDYMPGKSDWMAAGLPREGQTATMLYAGDIARIAVPTCHFRERARETLERMEAEGQQFCVAVDEDRIVLGMLYRDEHNAPSPDATVESMMQSGPTTIRAHEQLGPLVERMKRAGVDAILVTNADGRLLGLLDRREAEQALETRQRR